MGMTPAPARLPVHCSNNQTGWRNLAPLPTDEETEARQEKVGVSSEVCQAVSEVLRP